MYCSTLVLSTGTQYQCTAVRKYKYKVQSTFVEYKINVLVLPRITLYFRFQVKSTKNTKYCTQFPITDFDMLFLVTIYKLELIECLQEYINYKSSEDFFFHTLYLSHWLFNSIILRQLSIIQITLIRKYNVSFHLNFRCNNYNNCFIQNSSFILQSLFLRQLEKGNFQQ